MSWVVVVALAVALVAVAYGWEADSDSERANTHLREMVTIHSEAAERARQSERHYNEEMRKLRVRLNKTQAEIDGTIEVLQEDAEIDGTAEVLQDEPEDGMLVLAGDGSAQDVTARGKE